MNLHNLKELILASSTTTQTSTPQATPHPSVCTHVNQQGIHPTPNSRIPPIPRIPLPSIHQQQTKKPDQASCHQCKTKKDVKVLLYCTNLKKCPNDPTKMRECQKKYCTRCLAKYYDQHKISQLLKIKNLSSWSWECPGCIGNCSCIACRRHRIVQSRKNQKNMHNMKQRINSVLQTLLNPTELKYL